MKREKSFTFLSYCDQIDVHEFGKLLSPKTIYVSVVSSLAKQITTKTVFHLWNKVLVFA